MITLVKHFTWAAENGNAFETDWVRVPEGFQNWQFACLVHSGFGSGAALLETTWDTGEVQVVGFAVNLSGAGLLTVQGITSGMGPMVRLAFLATSDIAVTVSAFLTHKST